MPLPRFCIGGGEEVSNETSGKDTTNEGENEEIDNEVRKVSDELADLLYY
jgi:hypothetical protein